MDCHCGGGGRLHKIVFVLISNDRGHASGGGKEGTEASTVNGAREDSALPEGGKIKKGVPFGWGEGGGHQIRAYSHGPEERRNGSHGTRGKIFRKVIWSRTRIGGGAIQGMRLASSDGKYVSSEFKAR